MINYLLTRNVHASIFTVTWMGNSAFICISLDQSPDIMSFDIFVRIGGVIYCSKNDLIPCNIDWHSSIYECFPTCRSFRGIHAYNYQLFSFQKLFISCRWAKIIISLFFLFWHIFGLFLWTFWLIQLGHNGKYLWVSYVFHICGVSLYTARNRKIISYQHANKTGKSNKDNQITTLVCELAKEN